MGNLNRRVFFKQMMGTFAGACVTFLGNDFANSERRFKKKALPTYLNTERLNLIKSRPLLRMAFGSCCLQQNSQPIWNEILKQRPDLFVFLGDNVYADTVDLSKMGNDYYTLKTNPDFSNFMRQVPIIGTWDDHDFGYNDVGREYPQKEGSKKHFLEFFEIPDQSSLRKQEGVYSSHFFGESKKQTQIILLDLRWFRSELLVDSDGCYVPNPDPSAQLLGEAQWRWLEEELKKPADFRVLGSSIQLVSQEHPWEKWNNFPREKKRLFDLIDRLQIRNLVTISGDMHFAELSMQKTHLGIEIYDLTSSGLNRFEKIGNPNSFRAQLFDEDCNFGMISLYWKQNGLEAKLEAFDSKGNIRITKSLEV